MAAIVRDLMWKGNIGECLAALKTDALAVPFLSKAYKSVVEFVKELSALIGQKFSFYIDNKTVRHIFFR